MSQTNAIMSQEQIAIEGVKRLINIVVGLKNDVFKEGVDFGVIPGTGDKPTLLQPGMEKLLRALHLRAEYIERSKIEDFDKGLFFYRYECRLIDWETGICVGTAIGSANSYESKWRWREQKRKCPVCGMETINRSKFPPKNDPSAEAGWYCYAKIGGCGKEFSAKDPLIVGQQIGRIENPDIFDQMNTCDKISQKRSLGSAVKTVANVSMLYNIDLEDFIPYEVSGDFVQGTGVEVKRNPPANGHKSASEPSASVRGAGINPTPPTSSPASTAPTSANGASVNDLLTSWADDETEWQKFLDSAEKRLGMNVEGVETALAKLPTDLADWHVSKGWATAAVVAAGQLYDAQAIEAYTGSQKPEGQWFDICSMALAIAKAQGEPAE